MSPPPARFHIGAIFKASPLGCCSPSGAFCAVTFGCRAAIMFSFGMPSSPRPYRNPVAPYRRAPVLVPRSTVNWEAATAWGATASTPAVTVSARSAEAFLDLIGGGPPRSTGGVTGHMGECDRSHAGKGRPLYNFVTRGFLKATLGRRGRLADHQAR